MEWSTKIANAFATHSENVQKKTKFIVFVEMFPGLCNLVNYDLGTQLDLRGPFMNFPTRHDIKDYLRESEMWTCNRQFVDSIFKILKKKNTNTFNKPSSHKVSLPEGRVCVLQMFIPADLQLLCVRKQRLNTTRTLATSRPQFCQAHQ